ncbi:MAG: DNA recombination protein RmuC [Lentisphaerae bacterium]|nr:DNA recombination protein RmuC [Lentisphaerota bacterium]
MAMDFLLPVLIIVAVVGLAAWWLRHALLGALRRDTDAQALVLLQNQMQAGLTQTSQQAAALQQHLREELRLLNEQVARALTEANRTLGDRLDNTAKVVGDVRERLGQMDEASKRIFDVGRDIAELQQTLQAPKLRGGLSEYLLAELLAQVLPEQNYLLQYKFKGGETVDAVIRLSSGLAAIDAKFPLENFKRSLNAADEAERLAAGKQFARDVKKHIDDIARKYIRTDEGTFDFALMYIPAENVYYSIIVRREGSDDEALFQYALKRRVIPVSPNSFYAYLQTILLGLRGLRVEESAREIMDNLERLAKDLESFTEDFRVVGQHLGNAQKRYEEADKRLSRVEVKLEQMSGLTSAVEGETVGALPP